MPVEVRLGYTEREPGLEGSPQIASIVPQCGWKYRRDGLESNFPGELCNQWLEQHLPGIGHTTSDHHPFGVEHRGHPPGELGSAGAAGQHDYVAVDHSHAGSGRPVRRTPAWTL